MTPTAPPAIQRSPGPAGSEVERLERGLVALLRWLQDRATLGALAERSGHDLPPASWALLDYLDTRGAMRVSDVAACHGVHTSSIIPRLKTLEQAGLIDRGTQPDDARVSIISITTTGRQALGRIRATRQAALADAVQGVELEALATAGDVLNTIADQLAAQPDDPHYPPAPIRAT